MNLLRKIKETCYAVLPICAVVLALGTTVVPLGRAIIVPFCVGSAFLIFGLALFLTGADLGIVPAGAYMGAKLTATRSMPLILGTGLLIGFLITVAEPDLLVLGEQVETVTGVIPAKSMILAVALGVGLFIALALARVLLQIPYRIVLLVGYALAFFLASRVSAVFVAIAFDSGGATTGPMTVPFIIALGIGTSAVRGDKTAVEDGFGYTGIASIGPILAVTALGFVLSAGNGPVGIPSPGTMSRVASHVAASDTTVSAGAIALEALRLLPTEAKDVFTALAPLFAILVAYQIFLLKLPPRLFRRIAFGFLYAWLGLILFFTGADLAFVPAGQALGTALGALEANWILIPVGCALGAIVVCAEPAVWVLTGQVEEASGGNIRKTLLLATLAIGVAVSVGLSMCRVLFGFSVWYLLVPFYALALALTFATPRLFTAIAFDSGGVASGPMASTFILSLTLGASAAVGGNPATDGFGVIAMIAATPLVAIQVLGMLFSFREKRALGRNGR
jgi:hypothetical protein